jgi:hypothetical protein
MFSVSATDEGLVVISESFGISSHPRTDRWANSMLHWDPLEVSLYQPVEGRRVCQTKGRVG